MLETNWAAFGQMPVAVREIVVPVWIVAGSFALRKLSAILEKLFKALGEFLTLFSKVSAVLLVAYFVLLAIRYFS